MYYEIKGSGRHYPEVVRKIKDINADTVEVESVGYLQGGRLVCDGYYNGRKYVKTEDLQPYQ